MSSTNRRREGDVMKLMMSDFKVDFLKDGMHEFHVEFHGPKDSPYQGGVWKVYVRMNENYPYKAPTIKFANRIFHPNIDEKNGSICLDVMDQKWSPMFALINVFELFLPQLLLYPNPGHPLNGDAAALMRENLTTYEQKVKEHCQNHAKPVEVEIGPEKDSSDDEQSELSSDDEDATIP